jgi:hypothetical protein
VSVLLDHSLLLTVTMSIDLADRSGESDPLELAGGRGRRATYVAVGRRLPHVTRRAGSGRSGRPRLALAMHKHTARLPVCSAVVGISDAAEAPDNRAPSRRYLKPAFGCLRCSFTDLRSASWTRYLKQCLRRTGSYATRVTCVYPLVAALLSSELRPEPHVSDMSPTQNPCSARAFLKWA